MRAGTLDATLTSTERRGLQREGRLIVDLLQNLNYTDRQFHQIEAKEMIDRYLAALDPEKLLVTKADEEFLHRRFDRSLKSVYLLKGDFQPALEIFELVRQRVRERMPWIETWLKAEPDLTSEDVFTMEKEPGAAADAAACDRRWELRLKRAVIEELLGGRDLAAAKAETGKKFVHWEKELTALNAVQVRERFLETVIGLFDPHSGYFSPEHAEDFQIQMQGAVAGVGLEVRGDEERCLVADVLPGSPADELGELQAGDEILALANDDEVWVETSGKRVERLTNLLRGEPGKRLRVAFRRGAEGERHEVVLTRRRTVLPAQRARGALATVPAAAAAHRVGWIELPDFYAAGEGAEASSATADVRELIEQMKQKGADGLVLDLRQNPGGAMKEAVALCGLFIPGGPVLVTKANDGKLTEENAPPAPAVWAGPLVLLVSRNSASASEVFAGAMRFHRRALVIGSARTFGKGTAQNYIDLNRSPAHGGVKQPWGTLRVTMQRFYFPDGKSPQRAGAEADIVLTTAETGEHFEADLPQALTADTLTRPAAERAKGDFATVTADALTALKAATDAREKALPEFDVLRRGEALWSERTQRKTFSLKLTEARKERDEWETKVAALRRESRGLATSVGFATETIETEAVRATLELHAALARKRRPEDAEGKDGWLRGGCFFRETERGELGEVGVGQIDFARYVGDAEKLAGAFRARAGGTIGASEMADALRELSHEERLDEVRLLQCFAARGGVDGAAARKGAEALLAKIAELEPGVLVRRPGLDVVGREGLRLAADWAESRAAATTATKLKTE